jgi:D-alanyl-D-alanine carboxypeptidase
MSHTPNFKLNMSNTSGSLYSSIVASQSFHPHTFLQRYSYHRLFRHTSVGLLLLLLASCSVTKKIGKQAEHVLLSDTAISTGHIGISIYEPATNSFWYNHDATKYFVPASNTKLFSLYAGLKYLGDSVPGLRYEADANGVVRIQPTGDPSFLHPDYRDQPVYSFLQGQSNLNR